MFSGNLVILSSLFRASLHHIRPIALIGGATAVFGDPSGRSRDREIILREQIQQNFEKIHAQIADIADNFARVYGVADEFRLKIVNNLEWYVISACNMIIRVVEREK